MKWLLYAVAVSAYLVQAGTVLRVDIDSVVHPVTVEILDRAVSQARSENASLILLRLNTPGGLMEASRKIVETMMSAPIPVVCYVSPGGARAASAGFFLLLAGDVAAMAPGTRTGAASPVLMGQELDPVMRRKIESDAGAALRTMAARHGRNAELAEKAVSEAKSFTEQEALDAKLIDLIATDETDLFQKLEGRIVKRPDGKEFRLSLQGAVVKPYQPTLRQSLLKAISDPNIAFVLVLLGALGLYVEFSSPGLILPGVAGAILALLGLAALSVLPINWLGAALILLALALFVLEAKFASSGILGVGGAVAMVLGAMMLVEGPPEFRIQLSTALGASIPFALIAIFLTTLVFRAHMLGRIGVAKTALEPRGKVFVFGEYWDATSSRPVAEGGRVRVVALDGLHLQVEPED
jgi:membrane-bound serine protease (ClpP class)